jgi:hypothetical protein
MPDGLIEQMLSWHGLLFVLLMFGFAPGLVLRFALLAYPRDHPDRAELLGEYYAVPYIERPLFVAAGCERAICDGLPARALQMRERHTWRIRAAASAAVGALVERSDEHGAAVHQVVVTDELQNGDTTEVTLHEFNARRLPSHIAVKGSHVVTAATITSLDADDPLRKLLGAPDWPAEGDYAYVEDDDDPEVRGC